MSKYDYNVIVIGAGSAGLVSSYIASAVKAKVLLIEKYKMGGDCLNTGCVPSKAFIRSAKMMSYARRAKEFGFKKTEVKFEFQDIMKRVQSSPKFHGGALTSMSSRRYGWRCGRPPNVNNPFQVHWCHMYNCVRARQRGHAM